VSARRDLVNKHPIFFSDGTRHRMACDFGQIILVHEGAARTGRSALIKRYAKVLFERL
jgi:hypothetical protein